MYEVIEKIKVIRVDISNVINTVKGGNGTNYFPQQSREISLAYTNLQRGKMWLGKVLHELGTGTPYPQSENPNNKVIEPQADQGKTFVGIVTDDHVAKVKDIQAKIQVLADRVKEVYLFNLQIGLPGYYCPSYYLESIKALEEAKMWYGWELDRIRKDNP